MATQLTGTSLEILAPYLPYKLEMAWVEAPYDMLGKGHCLRSLSDFEGHEVAIGHRAARESFDWYPYDMVLPVLRPFSQLCEPLEDGTALVEKLASILFGDTLEQGCELSAGFDWFGNYVATANGVLLFSITLYWHIKCGNDLPAGFEAYDYLRSKHFAVGLEPSQFIPKIGVLPTIEKGKSRE